MATRSHSKPFYHGTIIAIFLLHTETEGVITLAKEGNNFQNKTPPMEYPINNFKFVMQAPVPQG
ncbi:hypothetical protein ACJX0J_030748, partial [Zea mays]